MQVWLLNLFSKLKGEACEAWEVAESVSHFHCFRSELGSSRFRHKFLWCQGPHTQRVSEGWKGGGSPISRKQSHLLCLQEYSRLQLRSHFWKARFLQSWIFNTIRYIKGHTGSLPSCKWEIVPLNTLSGLCIAIRKKNVFISKNKTRVKMADRVSGNLWN